MRDSRICNFDFINAQMEHSKLEDMPSSTNSDHDGRYLNLDGESTDVTNGNFNLTTLKTITAEQLTSTDDITMAGLLTNTLFAEDATGIYIDGTLDPYTGTATNYIQRLTRDITGNISASFTSYGSSKVFDNAKRFTGSVSPDVNMITHGDFKDITVSGVHSGTTSSDFTENNYASYNQLTRSGTPIVGASAISFNTYGSFNKAIDEIIWNQSGETAVIKDYGSYNEVVQSGAETQGTMQKTGYAGYFKATGTTDGTSVLYGVYIDAVSGADTNWGLFDNSGADGAISGKLRIGSTAAPTVALDVTGAITSTGAISDGAASSFTTGTTIGNLTLADGSITDSSGAISFGNENLTTSGSIISTGGAQTGKFLTGGAGNTVFAFSGGNFDIRAGDGMQSSQNVLRVTSVGDFDFKAGNLITTGEINFRDTDISINSILTDGILDMSADVAIDMFFDNADRGAGEDGQHLNINRRAAGDDYISLYVDKNRKGLIGFSGDDDLLQLEANALTVNGTLDVYENTADITNAGITVEQDGAGDATIHYLLTGGQEWTTGIDNSSSGDPYVISTGSDVGVERILELSTMGNLDLNPSGVGTSGGRITTKGKTQSDAVVDIYTAKLERSAGAAGIGLGLRYLFQIEDTSTFTVDCGGLSYEWTDATGGSATSKFSLETLLSGSTVTAFSITGQTTAIGDGGTTNYTQISATGDIMPKGSAFLVFEKASGNGIKVDQTTPTFGFADLLGDQFSKNTGGTKPTLVVYNGDVDAWQFSNGDEAFMSYHIPHDYVLGTDIFLHIHWSQNAAGATGGTIDFKYFAIYAKGHNQASGSTFTSTPITDTFTSININDGGSGLNQYQQHFTEVIISGASATAALFDRDDFEPDGVIELTLEMDADNLTGTPSSPFIHYVDIHYQTTGLIGTKAKAPDFYA